MWTKKSQPYHGVCSYQLIPSSTTASNNSSVYSSDNNNNSSGGSISSSIHHRRKTLHKLEEAVHIAMTKSDDNDNTTHRMNVKHSNREKNKEKIKQEKLKIKRVIEEGKDEVYQKADVSPSLSIEAFTPIERVAVVDYCRCEKDDILFDCDISAYLYHHLLISSS